MRRVGIPCIALALALSLPAASAQAARKIASIATLPGYSPFCFYTDQANEETWQTVKPGHDTPLFQGYSWDVVRASFQAVGYTLRLRIVPWARAMYELKTGKVDLLFPAGRNAKRLKYMNYSQQPVNAVNFRVYVRQGEHVDWHGLNSLKGLTIGAARGWNFGNAWNKSSDFTKQQVGSIKQGFAMLDRKRIDGFAGYEVVWDYKLAKLGKAGKYDKLPPFGQSREYVTALKSNPTGKQLLAAFDRGRQIIEQNGTMARIKKRWR